MFDGSSVAAALKKVGVTHIIWIPDSHVGLWENGLSADTQLHLIRVCRESEAIAVAAGLYLGGKQPVVIMQCTGFFDAGDSLRNAVHDMKLPIFLIVGVRNYRAYLKKATEDTCPVFTEPIVQAWKIPSQIIDEQQHSLADLQRAYLQARSENRPGIVLLAE